MVGQSWVLRYIRPLVGFTAPLPQFDPPRAPGMRDRLRQSRRSEKPFVAHSGNPLLPCGALLGCEDIGVHIVSRDFLTCEGRGSRREWLRRPRLLTRHQTFGNRTFLDGPQRLACHAIEHIQESLLAGLRHDVHAIFRRASPSATAARPWCRNPTNRGGPTENATNASPCAASSATRELANRFAPIRSAP